jgi:hypothetical protein
VKFALVYAYDPTTTSPSEDEVPAWIALDEEFRAAGVAVHEAGFYPADQGRTVRVRDGGTIVEKEPAAPAANTVAGYYVVDVADIEAATALAAKVPTAAYGYVEVRQVVEFEG